ncbi:MAG: hypothetical protein NZ580_02195 [Bacteroidia bacterium]|nr:hypothetical protein [Bacteroidia bacterium]MDW8235781.1 hypothetical protein [Bacteroidia bacterium]
MWAICLGLWGQTLNLPNLEKELAAIGHIILYHQDTQLKDSLNRIFLQKWKDIFSYPEHFSYPFDSVVTVSDLCPPDSAFRILTWQIIDFSKEEHSYYGILVRRWRISEKSPWQVKVYELKAIPEPLEEEDIERRTLSPEEWVSALYYHPRHLSHGVLRYEATARIPRGSKIRKEKMHYYVLLGWNGYNRRRNYKVVETIFIDSRQPEKVFFGAPVLYVGVVPKMRILLPYPETTPLTLNYGWYVKKPGSRKHYPAIIVDHLSRSIRKSRMSEDPRPFYGADGSYDAIEYWKGKSIEGRKGILVYRRGVTPYDPEMERYTPSALRKPNRQSAPKETSHGKAQR